MSRTFERECILEGMSGPGWGERCWFWRWTKLYGTVWRVFGCGARRGFVAFGGESPRISIPFGLDDFPPSTYYFPRYIQPSRKRDGQIRDTSSTGTKFSYYNITIPLLFSYLIIGRVMTSNEVRMKMKWKEKYRELRDGFRRSRTNDESKKDIVEGEACGIGWGA